MAFRRFFSGIKSFWKKPTQTPATNTPKITTAHTVARRKMSREMATNPYRRVENPYPEIPREHKAKLLGMPLMSKTFVEVCKALGKNPQKVFVEMLGELETSVEPIWLKAEKTFRAERERIAALKLPPEKQLIEEKKALERIFAVVMKTPKEA
jgi:hypothetical protein